MEIKDLKGVYIDQTVPRDFENIDEELQFVISKYLNQPIEKVDRFQNMSFWQRLKFLIFGKKVFKNATQ